MNTLRLLSNSIRVTNATPIRNSSSPMSDAQRRAMFASMRATGRPHAGRGTPSGPGAHVVKQGRGGDLTGATRFAPKADPSQGEWLTYTAGSSAFAKGNISYAHNDAATLQSMKENNPSAWSNLVAQYPSLESIVTNRAVSDSQRRAIFAKLKGGSGGRSSSSGGSDSGTTSTSRSNSDSFHVKGNKLNMNPDLMAAAYGGNSKQQQYDMMKAMPPKERKRYTGPDAIQQMEQDNKAWLEQWGNNMAKLAQARANTAAAPIPPAPTSVTPAAAVSPPPVKPTPAPNNTPPPNAAPVPVATQSTNATPSVATPSTATPGAAAPVAAVPWIPPVQSSSASMPTDVVPVRSTNIEELTRLASLPGPKQAMYQNLLTTEQTRQDQLAQAGRPYVPSSQLTPQSPEWRAAKYYEQQMGLDELGQLITNSGRSVSEMSDDQRKAVMAKFGGGGGAARGYTGGARGGKRGPARNPILYVTPEGHARAVRDAHIGIQSDVTPFDLFAATAIDESLDGISQARMNTDNKWVDAALGVAALGLFAAGVKNARTQKALAQHLSAQKNFEHVLEQMGRDATRFDPMLRTSPSSTGDDIYRTYDQLAERVTRARGYPPSAAEANRWLDKAAPRVTSPSPARKPTVIEQVNAFRADTLSKTGIATTDNDISTFLLQKHPGIYIPPKNYIPPKSPTGDVFRSEAAKTMGSQQAQLLDYARRADMEAVAPRVVKNPWQSTADVLARIVNKELHMNTPLTPGLRLIKNAIRVTQGVIANAGPMTDEQRRAMFAGGGRGPARSSSAAIGRIKGSTQNFDSSYSGPKKQTINKDLVSYKPYQKEMSAFEKWQLTPNGMKPDTVPPNAGPEYYAARTVANYDRFKKQFPADQNPPKEWLAVHPEWKPTKTSSIPTQYPWSHDFVMSDGTLTYGGGGDRQVQAPPTAYKPGFPSQKVSPGRGTNKTPPVYYLPPNDKGIGYYNPNQPYVPGQPRIDERGQPIWGPGPGEPGFIDFDAWRKGAQPRGPGIPISQPSPGKKDTVN